MPKELHSIQGVPSEASTDKRTSWKSKASRYFVFCVFCAMIFVGPASAATMNWTSVTEMIEGVTTIFPSIASMITEIVPTLLLLAVVGFVIRFFDSILGAVEAATRVFK